MTIAGLLNGVRSLNFREAVTSTFRQTKADLILLNQLQLYNDGVDANGNKLSPYKNDRYALKKNSRNPGPGLGQPDLKDTGDFYRDFTLEVSSEKFEVDSKDSKSLKLKKDYGNEIFGLTKDNRKVYALGVYYTALQKLITFKTGLRFN